MQLRHDIQRTLPNMQTALHVPHGYPDWFGSRALLNVVSMERKRSSAAHHSAPPRAGFTNHAVTNFKLRARIFTLAPYHDSGLTRSKRMVKANKGGKRQVSSSVVGNEVKQTFDEPAHARYTPLPLASRGQFRACLPNSARS